MKCPGCGLEAYEDIFEDRDGSLNCPQCGVELIIVVKVQGSEGSETEG